MRAPLHVAKRGPDDSLDSSASHRLFKRRGMTAHERDRDDCPAYDPDTLIGRHFSMERGQTVTEVAMTAHEKDRDVTIIRRTISSNELGPEHGGQSSDQRSWEWGQSSDQRSWKWGQSSDQRSWEQGQSSDQRSWERGQSSDQSTGDQRSWEWGQRSWKWGQSLDHWDQSTGDQRSWEWGQSSDGSQLRAAVEALPTEVASAAAALPNNPEPDEASVEARCTYIRARLRAASPHLRHIAAHLRLRAALPHNPAPLEETNTPRAVRSETSETPRAVIETFENIERALVKVLGPECSLKPHELCYYN